MTGTGQTAAEQKDIRILAVESSCDKTAAAVVENDRTARSNVIYSQIATHTLYGGVVPEITSRAYIEKINQVTAQTPTDTGLTLVEIDAIGVTCGPGLMGPLLIDISAAKAMIFAAGKPLIGVNRIEGHVSTNPIASPDLKPPFLCLIVFGGHTNLVMVEGYRKFRILGQTRDGTVGEAFDKVARSVGPGYSGGSKVGRKAREGDPDAINFPRTEVTGSPYDLSFSGLKSAVLNYQNHAKIAGEEIPAADLVALFQKAIAEVLVSHTMETARDFNCKTIAMAGSIAADSVLHKAMRPACEVTGYALTYPEPGLCTDNTAMIGSAAHYEYCAGRKSGWNLNAISNLELGGR